MNAVLNPMPPIAAADSAALIAETSAYLAKQKLELTKYFIADVARWCLATGQGP